jgi:hypothetical protein
MRTIRQSHIVLSDLFFSSYGNRDLPFHSNYINGVILAGDIRQSWDDTGGTNCGNLLLRAYKVDLSSTNDIERVNYSPAYFMLILLTVEFVKCIEYISQLIDLCHP